MTKTIPVALLLFASLAAGCSERSVDARTKTPGSGLTEIDDWAAMKWDDFVSAMDLKLQQADRRIEELKAEIKRKGKEAEYRDAESKWTTWKRDLQLKVEEYRNAGASATASLKADIANAWAELKADVERTHAKLNS